MLAMARARNIPRPTALELLPDDAVCRKCNYSLAGLPAGGVCPECGTPTIRARGSRGRDVTITDAPIRYLRFLALGCVVLALAGPGTLLSLLTAYRDGSLVACAIAGASSLLWLA